MISSKCLGSEYEQVQLWDPDAPEQLYERYWHSRGNVSWTTMKFAQICSPKLGNRPILYHMLSPEEFAANQRLRFQFHLLMITVVAYAVHKVYTTRRKWSHLLGVPLSAAFCSIQNQSFSIMSKYLRAKYSVVTAECNKIIRQVPDLLKVYHGSAAEHLLRILCEVKKEGTACKEYMESRSTENLPNFAEISLDDHKKVFEEDCRMIDKFQGKVDQLKALVSAMKAEDPVYDFLTMWYPKMVELLSTVVHFVRDYLGVVRVIRKKETPKADVVSHQNPTTSETSEGSRSSFERLDSRIRHRFVEPISNWGNGSESWDSPLLGTVSGDDVIPRPPSVASSVTSQWSIVEDLLEEEKQE